MGYFINRLYFFYFIFGYFTRIRVALIILFSMAYSPADLASVEAAIISLSTGSRTARVRHGTDEIEFNNTGIKQLQALRDTIIGELRTVSDGSSKVKFNFK